MDVFFLFLFHVSKMKMLAVLLAALACVISTVHALDAGEVTALEAVRSAWANSSFTARYWSGSPSCSWEGLGCDGDEGVLPGLGAENGHLRRRHVQSLH